MKREDVREGMKVRACANAWHWVTGKARRDTGKARRDDTWAPPAGIYTVWTGPDDEDDVKLRTDDGRCYFANIMCLESVDPAPRDFFFKPGDLVIRTRDGNYPTPAYRAGHTFVVHSVDIYIDGENVLEAPCSVHHRGSIALLRPVDWVPKPGDRVVLTEDYSQKPRGTIFVVANDPRKQGAKPDTLVQLRGLGGTFLRRLAPFELAEPLLPLLRGEATPAGDPTALVGSLVFSKRHGGPWRVCAVYKDAVTNKTLVNLASRDTRSGVAGLPIEDISPAQVEAPRVLPAPAVPAAKLAEARPIDTTRERDPRGAFCGSDATGVDRLGRQWLGSLVVQDEFEAGPRSWTINKTLREQRDDARWRCDDYDLQREAPRGHCKRCGSTTGCMHERPRTSWGAK